MQPSLSQTSVVHFPEPISGFPEDTSFRLEPIGTDGLLFGLRSEVRPQIRFVLAPPEAFFTGYAPAIERGVLPLLGAASVDELSVYVILSLADGVENATANLMAPLVLNERAGLGAQVVLEGSGYPVRVKLGSDVGEA